MFNRFLAHIGNLPALFVLKPFSTNCYFNLISNCFQDSPEVTVILLKAQLK